MKIKIKDEEVMSKTIQLKGVSKDFKGDGVITKALNNITLSLQKGIFTSIIGSSGSGKSTLLSLIGTLDKPSDGKIFYDEKEITNLNNKSLSDIRFEKSVSYSNNFIYYLL